MRAKLLFIAARIAEAVAIKLAMDGYDYVKAKRKEYLANKDKK